MQYHALALARTGADVDFIGYAGTPVIPAVREQTRIACHALRPGREGLAHRLPRPVFFGYAAVRAGWHAARLLWALLFEIHRPDVVLVQTPPAIPALAVALLAARLRSARLVIDWHNFGYTMLALGVGRDHPAVRAARRYEAILGRRADAHLCVSQAMQSALETQLRVAGATVLHDCPPRILGPTPLHLRQELFRRLAPKVPAAVISHPERPAIAVSATSWTADEDFLLLLDAIPLLDARIRAHDAESPRPFPHLLVLITGNGPLRRQWEARFRTVAAAKIQVRTLWVSPEDYPLLLGSADVGLCLHRSSSGVDLPMKVADMFGAGLPVCALDYGPCLAEQVRHGENGVVFSTAADLAGRLYELFAGFPDHTPLLDALRRTVAARPPVDWLEAWNATARPVFAPAGATDGGTRP